MNEEAGSRLASLMLASVGRSSADDNSDNDDNDEVNAAMYVTNVSAPLERSGEIDL